MTKLLALVVILLGSTRMASAQVVLTSDASPLQITVADHPSGNAKNMVLVAWDHLPGPVASGAMVYSKDEASSETRYFAIGGGGLFSITVWGRRPLTKGVRALVVIDDPAHPVAFRADPDQKVDTARLLARYHAFENVAPPGEAKPVIQAAITVKVTETNKACGGAITPQIRWADFDKPGKTALAKQTISVLEAIASACADKDYRIELAKLRDLRVGFSDRAADLKLEKTGNALSVVFSDTSFNPREVARAWLEKNL